MATKREAISGMINRSVEERNLDPSVELTREPPRFVPPQKEKVTLRLDVGDYRKLQRIAAAHGTKASALIRQAIKEILKTAGGV